MVRHIQLITYNINFYNSEFEPTLWCGAFNSVSHDNISEFEPTLWCGAFNSLHMTTGRALGAMNEREGGRDGSQIIIGHRREQVTRQAK